MFILAAGKEFHVELIARRERNGWHDLKCGVLFTVEEEGDLKAHIERDHRIPYTPDAFGDVYDTREIVTPDAGRLAGAL